MPSLRRLLRKTDKQLRTRSLLQFATFSVGGKAIALLSTPFFAHFLSTAETGQTTVFITLATLTGGLAGGGCNLLAIRQSTFLNAEEYDAFKIAALVVIAMTGALLFSAGMLMPAAALSRIGIGKGYWQLALMTGTAFALAVFAQKVALSSRQNWRFGAQEAAIQALPFLCGAGLIAMAVPAPQARIFGYAAGMGAMALALGRWVQRTCGPASDWPAHISSILSFSVRGLPQIFANWLRMGVDKIALAVLIGVAELGVYATAYAFSSAFAVISNAANNHFAPLAVERYKRGEIRALRSERNALFALGLLGAVVLVLLLEWLYPWLAPDAYQGGIRYIRPLVAAAYCQFVYLLYAKYFLYSGTVGRLGALTLATSSLYLACLAIFAKGSPYAAAMSLLLSSSTLATMIAIIVTRAEARS